MSPATVRTLLCLLLTLFALIIGVAGLRPLKPTHVKLTAVDEGLEVTWEPPEEVDSRPVDKYSIGYGTSMKTLRFVKVDRTQRSQVLKDVEPGVLHFLKMTAENRDGTSKPVYRAETPKARSHDRRRLTEEIRKKLDSPRTFVLGSDRGYLLGLAQSDHRMLDKPRTQSQRSQPARQLASESVYVVSLQAQNAPRQSSSPYKAVMSKKNLEEPEEMHQAKDVTVRVMSPQSVMVSWVDPAVESEKSHADTRQYMVRYREKGESARWDFKETSQRRLLVDGLSADNMYEFSVRISQGYRQGPWSASIFQRTPESAPTGPPTNFHVKPLRGKGTAVMATWEPPEEPNGRIREYILTYAPALKPFGAKSITYSASVTSANIDGLQPGDSYIFKIRAANRRGQGPQTKAISIPMPATSTVASPQHTKSPEDSRSSRVSSRTSKHSSKDSKDADLQSTEETEDRVPIPPRRVIPVARIKRPLSQSRSYHSVFSSARSPVRSGAAGSTSFSPDKQKQSNKAAMTQKEILPESSEELVDDLDEDRTESKEQTVTQNNAVILRHVDGTHNSKTPTYVTGTSHHVTTHTSKSQATPLKPQPGSVPRIPALAPSTPAVSSQTQAGTESVKPRGTLPIDTRKSIIHSLESKEHADTSSSDQDDALTRKDYKATTHSDTKESHHHDTEARAQITSAKETSSKLNPSSSVQSQGGNRHTGSGLINSRRTSVTPIRSVSRVFPGQRKSGIPSTVAQSNVPTRIQKPQSTSRTSKNDHTAKLEDDDPDYKGSEPVIKDERPTPATKASPTHSFSSPVSNDDEEKNKRSRESRTQEYDHGSYPSSRTNFGSGIGRSFRLGVSNRTLSRHDARVPSSRDKSAPSVGANRPLLKETPLRSGISVPQETGYESTSSGLPTSKHLSSSGSSKPSFPNQGSVSSGSDFVKSSSSRGNAASHHSNTKNSRTENDDDNYDYVHHAKVTSEKSDKIITTSPPQSSTSATSQTSRPASSDNANIARNLSPRKESSPVPLFPRRPVVSSSGRFRSPLLANRQIGPRFPARILPAPHTQSGSSSPVGESSRLPSSSQTGASSPVVSSQLPHSSSRQTSNEEESSSVARKSPSSSQPLDTSSRLPVLGTRLRYPSRKDTTLRGKKPAHELGKNGRPNLTVSNGKGTSPSEDSSKPAGQRIIAGPDGAKWIVDLDKGLLMNENGKVLQDSQGRPHRVVLGEDGRTVFDSQGSPLVNPEGLALFGHGRDSTPVINPKDKVLTLGGKPLVGLDRPKPRTTTVQSATTEFSTLPSPTAMTTVEPTTMLIHPTCPPGTFSKMDDKGFPLLDADGILNCYTEEGSSGMDVDAMVTALVSTRRAGTLARVEEGFAIRTTLPPTTPAPPTQPVTTVLSAGPSSAFDAAGNKRFTAPYVNYIRKDPGAPCSLTEALEYLQVDVLENLLERDNQGLNAPPRNKPHNITVVAMEGCHSFVILDWARPLKDDMVSGYMVYSASYDDVLNNRWSSSAATGTHLPVENLKPNSRYYFKVQAKNVFGLGPISETLTYVTESDDPLLIERPPGGEPIWIPFSFKYSSTQSSCKGSQFVKRTWYRKFVGVVLCNSLRYKIFMGEGLKDAFYSVADTYGHGEDHCQFVDSYLEGRTGPHSLSDYLPTTQGFYRSYRQEPVSFGPIGQHTAHHFVGWYECGVPIPGKW